MIKTAYLKQAILAAVCSLMMCGAAAQNTSATRNSAANGAQETTTIRIFDEVTFYDGYLLEKFPDDCPTDDGILRHRTSLYAVPMTDDQLSLIGESLTLHVYVKAACDNYDRIGNVNIAFVPKGEKTYKPEDTTRIEIGRFITPFMDKNKQPDTVPYEYDVTFLSEVLRSTQIRAQYDIWVEFELFGIPYAANQQVAGCAGRNDVFIGTLEFETDTEPAPLSDKVCLVPIVIKRPEYQGGNFNNYTEGATDKIGITVKTWEFDLPQEVESGRIVFITSNHGANTNGEEYNRRQHYVYFDDEMALQYIPGGKSCEPYRVYNTQANGIYGASPRIDWQQWNNWCPGDVIPTRFLDFTTPLEAGNHKFKIRVIGAKFNEKQGDIPVSAFFIGYHHPFTDAVDAIPYQPIGEWYVEGDHCYVRSNEPIRAISVYTTDGQLLHATEWMNAVPLSACGKGIYVLFVEYDNGATECFKLLL